MNIFINNLPAVIAEGSNFDFTRENPLFSDSKAFSLDITFPMDGCPENQRIFGFINRPDFHKPTDLLSCSIVTGNMNLRGSVSVMETSQHEVKAQFLEGVFPDSEDLDIDKIYINEIDLGKYPVTDPKSISPDSALEGTGAEVCLPWLNKSFNVVNNYSHFIKDGTHDLAWDEETKSLTWQPFLVPLIKKIAAAAGYTPIIPDLEFSVFYRRIVICNTLPPTWNTPDYSDALPHWTVREFFKQIGMTLKGVFSFDESSKEMRFEFYGSIEKIPPVFASPIDEYSSAVSRDIENPDMLSAKKYCYPDLDDEVSDALERPVPKTWGNSQTGIDTYATWQEMMNASAVIQYTPEGHRLTTNTSGVCYVRENNTHYFRNLKVHVFAKEFPGKDSKDFPYVWFYTPQPISVFEPLGGWPENKTNLVELKACPAVIDWDLTGKILHLDPAKGKEYSHQDLSGDVDTSYKTQKYAGYVGLYFANRINNSSHRGDAVMKWERGENGSKESYYSYLFLAYVPENIEVTRCPVVDNDVTLDFPLHKIINIPIPEPVFRLTSSEGGAGETIVDEKVKYDFTFLSDIFPDPKAHFWFHGIEFVCRSLTANFSSSGMSPLIKGEFYRIIQ